MEHRLALIGLIVFLCVVTAGCLALLTLVPGAELTYGPLVLYLFVIPIGIAAWNFGPRAASWIGALCLTIAALVFCVPQYMAVHVHNQLDGRAIERLKVQVGAEAGETVTLGDGGTLSDLLDAHVSYTLLSRLWPRDMSFRRDFRMYLARPLFDTGIVRQDGIDQPLGLPGGQGLQIRSDKPTVDPEDRSDPDRQNEIRAAPILYQLK